MHCNKFEKVGQGKISKAKSGWFSTSSLIRPSNFTVPTIPILRPKLSNVPHRSFSMAIHAIMFRGTI